MADQRRYATLFAKGEDRRQRILAVAQRLMTRNGGRGTTLSQIAQEAGVTTAGLLHHFESKEQLLHAVLDARDADDMAHVDMSGDVIEQLERVTERFERSPDLIGLFTVLLTRKPRSRMPRCTTASSAVTRTRWRLSPKASGEGSSAGAYRTDLDPAVKAVEIIAFLYGMETSWLLDPSIPLTDVFRGYASTLARELALSPR